jgi:DNA-binding MarR family transcriptional regulator
MQTVRWLDDDQQRAWRLYQAMNTMLGAALDRQLQRDAEMPHGYYTLLAILSNRPGSRSRITELARRTFTSQSRTSHAVVALERRGWVRRERSEDDSRGTVVVLTPAGKRALRQAAPNHVEQVRTLLFDRLTSQQVHQLEQICAAVVDGLDAP